MRCTKLFACLAGFAASTLADSHSSEDLGTVLSQYKSLTNFTRLIKKYPDLLLQLPDYKGVTIVAPNNDAFRKIPYSALKNIWNPNNKDVAIPLLQYHILQDTLNTEDLKPGPVYMRPTLLKDPKFTNVTSGQNILIAKQTDNIVITSGMGNRVNLVDNDILF